jgi:tRNA dimethylallyltransferase
MSLPYALVLTGPTGSGKSDWAVRLAQHLPIEIVSVDSAQVYRGMDIGTAKPGAAVRARIAHHLLDIRDPAEHYSAGDFVKDASTALRAIHERGRLPVLVGGTMLYLRALLCGIAELPAASAAVREDLAAQAKERGWPAMHAELSRVDARAAARIHAHDAQRIQRALEVYRLTGRAISEWQAATHAPLDGVRWLQFALLPEDRAGLRRTLEARFAAMLEAGLLAEVAALHKRPDLHAELPALRSVGYRQLWAYCAGQIDLEQARSLAVTATCQLAKRQMTWLRAQTCYECLDPADDSGFARLLEAIGAAGFMAPGARGC